MTYAGADAYQFSATAFWHQIQIQHGGGKLYANNFSLFFWFLFACVFTYARVIPVYTCDAQRKHKRKNRQNGNRSVFLFLFLCTRRCVARVNRDSSASEGTSTRRLCLGRTDLHVYSVQVLVFLFVLILALFMLYSLYC